MKINAPKIAGFSWPVDVHVVTMDYLSGEPGCDVDNYPQSTFLWMQAEIRNPQSSIYGISLFIDIWTSRFVKIFTVAKRGKNRFTKADVYNATWASFGYVMNQCPVALELMEKA